MDVKEKLVELLEGVDTESGFRLLGYHDVNRISDHLIVNGVTVQEWISASEPPKEPGEYIVAQKHWSDGHLETKKGKWNGVEWLVDGRESLRVAYWMPMPEPPKGE